MERFWSNSIFKYLRVEPEDHYFLLTEPVSLLLASSVASLEINCASLSIPRRTARTLPKSCLSLSTAQGFTLQSKQCSPLPHHGLHPKFLTDH